MSIKLRLALMLSLLLAAFLVSLVLLRTLERRQLGQMLADSRQGRIDLLERWLDLTGASLRQFDNDYSQWDDMVRFLDRPDPQWAAVNLDASLANVDAQAAWVLRLDGSVAHAVNRWHDPALAAPPVPVAPLLARAAGTPFLHFFARSPRGLLEMRCAPIQPSADLARTTPPRGWLLVARLWDEAQLEALARLSDSRVTLAGADALATPPPDAVAARLTRRLADWSGQTIGALQLDFQSPDLAQALQTDLFAAWVFAAFGLVVILALALGLNRWVLRPLRWISDSLARSDTAAIQPLVAERERTELGRVALLIQSAFAQKAQLIREVEDRKRAEEALRHSEAALRRTLEEQARLGRNLHDSVIQSLYAAGMGLASIRAQIHDSPDEAEAKIEQTRLALNETIRDVRNFITGLEPEAVRHQSFAHALDRLVEYLRAVHPIQAAIAIDESLAATFTLAQRAHALQIAREAVSNAVRHGEAAHVRLALQRVDGRAEFTIDDDGRGFTPAAGSGSGRGLKNLAERARELGAELTVSSELGKGTRVTVVFPLPAPP